jgi:hypothetical protein
MEKERLQFCIDRFDHYYDSINNKGAVFLALSTFIIGGLVAAYPSLLSSVNCILLIHLLMFGAIGIGLVTMILLVRALTPFTDSVDSDSLFYFGSISSQREIIFHERSRNLTVEEELSDLRTQVRDLSIGLRNKFKILHLVGVLFTVQFILFVPLIISIIINLKK